MGRDSEITNLLALQLPIKMIFLFLIINLSTYCSKQKLVYHLVMNLPEALLPTKLTSLIYVSFPEFLKLVFPNGGEKKSNKTLALHFWVLLCQENYIFYLANVFSFWKKYLHLYVYTSFRLYQKGRKKWHFGYNLWICKNFRTHN